MKLLILLTVVACLQASANGFAQSVTLSLKDAPLEQAFKEIKKQTGYSFVYIRDQLKNTSPVNCQVKNAQLKEVLDICFRNQPLLFVIEDHYIVVQTKVASTAPQRTPLSIIDLSGHVINESGEALAGVTITAKKSNRVTSTNEKGEFTLKGINDDDILIITSVGYYKEEVQVNEQNNLLITLKIAVGSLDETIIIAYGKTTRRLSTGNISKVTSEEISKQPVTNPLAALEGRVPGLLITQSSGLPGSPFKVQIQGQRSIAAYGQKPIVTNDPLFVIDGVPFAAGNTLLSQVTSALGYPGGSPSGNNTGGISPLNLINPSDIESIEILKDADATSIYGSRGANGVILITTKKGKPGKTRINLSTYSGISKVTRTQDLLNTGEYLQMRKEAILNEGVTPNTSVFTPGYAPDLLIWDTTRFTDWKKYFIGGTAGNTDVQLSIAGGNANTQFLIGGGYNRQTTVFPGDFSDNKSSVHFNLNHISLNKKLTVNLNTCYTNDNNNLLSQDLTAFINIAPNFPSLTDASGKLKWSDNGVDFRTIGFANPLSFMFQKYKAESRNLNSNFLFSYRMLKNLILRTSIGYNTTEIDENLMIPLASQNPANSSSATSEFGHRLLKSWIIEPQAEYFREIAKGRLNILIGTSWQNIENNSNDISASGYTSDNLLGSISAAGSLSGNNDFSQYRYNAVFARINYNWQDKYIINLSGRRDGSSRFGPGRQFANFAAIGTSWIFSNEKFFHESLPFVSFGKLKVSYGTTGNDQIGNYIFLNSWSNNGLMPYQGSPVLGPIRLFNPDFGWESNKKLSGGVELGFINDRIIFSSTYYRNRTGNQLIVYNLPTQTGFPYLQAYNLPATVQNTGWEFVLSTKNISSKSFNWNTSVNLTINRNKLVSFPGLDKSPYSTTYVVGQSLSVINRLKYLGVDPSTGIYSFKDVNNDGTLDSKDYVVSGNLDPRFYGGFNNSISYKNFAVDFLFEFRKQLGTNYLADQAAHVPGFFYFNQSSIVLNRWQKPGDIKSVQRLTSDYGNAFTAVSDLLPQSNGIYSDASFIRLKNLSVSYSLSGRWITKLHFETCRLFILAQNLFTITNYKGADPETQTLSNLPPLRTITGGFQLNF